MVDATQNPLARVHSGSRHLALRFARLVVDGRVHHIIVSIERIAAPRVVPHTIEVPALNEDTFAKRLAGETGTRPALKIEHPPVVPTEEAAPEQSVAAPAPVPVPAPVPAPSGGGCGGTGTRGANACRTAASAHRRIRAGPSRRDRRFGTVTAASR